MTVCTCFVQSCVFQELNEYRAEVDRLRAAEATLKDEIAHMAKALLISCAVKVLLLTPSGYFSFLLDYMNC